MNIKGKHFVPEKEQGACCIEDEKGDQHGGQEVSEMESGKPVLVF